MAPTGPKSDVIGGGFRVGDTLSGRYVLERKIGRGGMGVVAAGRRIVDGQRVAIKLLLVDGSSDQAPKHVARLIREAKATAALADEHVVRLYDVDTLEDGTCFLVMELLDGEDLAKHVRTRGPLPVAEAVDLVIQACAGVAEAHARGIVHRDLKPHNLFLARRPIGDPVVKVLDFGISKIDEGEEGPLTTTGDALGSPQYMSLEQFQNSKGVDRRTDIWALGMILHHLLTGKTAYEAGDLATYLFRLSTELPRPVREHRADLPAALEAIILRCLERNPNARYYHVGEFAHALTPFSTARSVGALARIQHYASATPQIAAAPAPPENLQVLQANSTYGQAPVQSGTNDAVMRENVSASGKRRNAALVVFSAAIVCVLGLAFFVARKSSMATPPAIVNAAPGTPTNVIITVAVNPATATLELDGQTVQSPLELPYDDKDHTLLVRADGHVSKTKTIRPNANAYLDISLDAVAAPEPVPSADTAPERTSRNASTRPAPAPAPAPTPESTQNRKKLKGPMADSL